MEVNTDLFTQASVVSSASGKILQFNLAAEEVCTLCLSPP